MKKPFVLLFVAIVALNVYSQTALDSLAFVTGGPFRDAMCTNYYGKGVTVSNFYIGKYEVTQKEWTQLMGSNPSQFQGDNLPVETVSWYECTEYCNRRSAKEGLKPYYNINRSNPDPNNHTIVDDVKWTVTINAGADGYRLPTEMEWLYAASGGQKSKSYNYCGDNDIEKVAWYWRNSGDSILTGEWTWPVVQQNHDRTHSVGGKKPNELGLYDMSGNVREWCWDWYGDSPGDGTGPAVSSSETGRVWMGGGWMGGDFCCELSFRANFEANGKGPDQGLRVCRSQ